MAVCSLLRTPLVLLTFIKIAYSSVGDSSPFYNHCIQDCKHSNCNSEKDNALQYGLFGFGVYVWTCLENCEYQCQWKTVSSFQNKNWAVPQFKGKWPFIRLFGLQEPASAIFSVFNFFVHLIMLKTFRRKVDDSSPYYYLWHLYCVICLNGWFWSSVYHSRDSDFTEKMDYISAFTMVMFSLYCMGLRFIDNILNWKTLIWSLFCGSIGLNHVAYLWFYNFDYGYNMKFNCVLGLLNAFGWFIWSSYSYKSQPYTWKVAAYVVLIVFSIFLELLDFPPIFWLFDAHSLWHFSTGFITFLFYDFLIDDCNYMNEFKVDKLLLKSKVK